MLYDAFLSWCEAKGVTPQQATAELGLCESSPKEWRTHAPGKKVLPRLAAYFGMDMQTVCDAAREHYLQRPGYKPEIYTMETVARNGTVMTRSTYEYIPQLPMPWACRRLTAERLVSDEYMANYKARTIAMAAPDAIPILRRMEERT